LKLVKVHALTNLTIDEPRKPRKPRKLVQTPESSSLIHLVVIFIVYSAPMKCRNMFSLCGIFARIFKAQSAVAMQYPQSEFSRVIPIKNYLSR